MTALSIARIRDLLSVYGYSAEDNYCERVHTYVESLLRWNRKVALTTVTDPEQVVRFHFGESLFGMQVSGMQNGRLADVGSGAGFPGAPIAMAMPAIQATLIESNGKKAAFLEEIRRELGLNNVVVHRGRAEEVRDHDSFDFITMRALGAYREWLDWSAERLAADGRAVLWLSARGIEEACVAPGWKWSAPTKIPKTKDRFVAVASRGG